VKRWVPKIYHLAYHAGEADPAYPVICFGLTRDRICKIKEIFCYLRDC